jgi:galactokinase/mevalonate kinase-like predicted kinase
MDTPERPGRGAAHARAALAGNPSDGYGGAVLAFTFAERGATATAAAAHQPSIEPPAELVEATVRRFARDLAPETPRRAHAVTWRTDVPRGVGLGGSSAIVIATLRALCDLHAADRVANDPRRLAGLALANDPRRLAGLALAIEREELGIAAGLQDRVAQTHGGVTFMDFGADCRDASGHGRYERLQPDALPRLLIAWCTDAIEDSGTVHAPLRDRFERGEPVVVEGMARLGALAREARAAVLARDPIALGRCADASFDARRTMLELHPRHVELIECARSCGVGANYTGSGGAIVGVCVDERQRERAREALARIGAETLEPTIEP